MNSFGYLKVMQIGRALSAFLVFAVLGSWSIASQSSLFTLYVHSSYYIVLWMVIFWVKAVSDHLATIRFSFRLFLLKQWPWLLLALLLSVLVFLSLKPQLRILSDETNLLSVSYSMLDGRQVLNRIMGLHYYGNFWPIEEVVEKRPLLFPFFTHLLHMVLGYGVHSAFAVNFILLSLLLFGVSLVVRRRLDAPSTAAAMLLVIASPLITISATSAGYDLLSLFFLLLSVGSLYGYMKSPESAPRFALMMMNLVMLAHTRHESAIFLPLVLALLGALGYLTRRFVIGQLPLFGAVLLFMLPWVWQKFLSAGDYENPSGVPLFAFSHLTEHFAVMIRGMADLRLEYPHNAPLVIFYLGALMWFCVGYARGKMPLTAPQRHFALILITLLAVTLLIPLAHFFGIYTHPTQARLFLPFAFAVALGPVFFKMLRPDAFGRYGLLLLAILLLIPYHAAAVSGRFMNTMELSRESQHCYEFLGEQKGYELLVISDRPGQYAALNYGAVSFGYANTHVAAILENLGRHLYRDIYVFQRISYQTGSPVEETTLGHPYYLEPLREIQITAGEYLRISRVVPQVMEEGRASRVPNTNRLP